MKREKEDSKKIAAPEGIPPHILWLTDKKKKISTVDKIAVDLWELCHTADAESLSKWAKHFRNFYCHDDEIDGLASGTGHSRAEYLTKIVFPDQFNAPGPSIRAGDFSEVLVADYLAYELNYWVPGFRYDEKAVRNESTKGADVIGFQFVNEIKGSSPKDTLAVFEVKAQFTGKKPKPRLQNAVDGSKKDVLRRAESLNAIKRRFLRNGSDKEAKKVERFQNHADNPYRQIFGAVACFTNELVDEADISATDCRGHPHRRQLRAMVICGANMMELVHKLYELAANEA